MTDLIDSNLVDLTSRIVSAFVSNNSIPPIALPGLMSEVHGALAKMASVGQEQAQVADIQQPAVSVKKSITDDYLVCLEDGGKFRSLKRHLTTLGMTPEQYRAKWNLPANYPMVAPGYSAARSTLARTMGLGSIRRKAVKAAPEPQPEPAAAQPAAKKAVGRPRKKAA